MTFYMVIIQDKLSALDKMQVFCNKRISIIIIIQSLAQPLRANFYEHFLCQNYVASFHALQYFAVSSK